MHYQAMNHLRAVVNGGQRTVPPTVDTAPLQGLLQRDNRETILDSKGTTDKTDARLASASITI